MIPNRRPRARLVLAAAAAGLLVPAAGVALAQSSAIAAATAPITCNGGTCEGTEENDTLVASNGAERVIGRGGDDDIELDAAFPGGSSDLGIGGPGRDCIDGGAAAT
jgi:hypothetical protein